jgi:hypothetical protein
MARQVKITCEECGDVVTVEAVPSVRSPTVPGTRVAIPDSWVALRLGGPMAPGIDFCSVGCTRNFLNHLETMKPPEEDPNGNEDTSGESTSDSQSA